MVFSTVHRFGVPGGSDGRSDLGVQKHLYLTRHALPLLQRLEGILRLLTACPTWLLMTGSHAQYLPVPWDGERLQALIEEDGTGRPLSGWVDRNA